MTVRELARRAFWSDHPLGLLYAIAHGQWIAEKFRPASAWSLHELVRFAETLPADVLANISGETVGRISTGDTDGIRRQAS